MSQSQAPAPAQAAAAAAPAAKPQPRPSSSGPESLDDVIKTTNAHGWWALWAIAALCVAALVWAFVATIPTQVTGTGVVSTFAYSTDITATTSGTVQFKPGIAQQMKKGDVIADIVPFDGSSAVSVVAPTDGELTSILVNDGQGVEPGIPLAVLVEPVNPKAGIKIVTYVSESQALDYAVGETASVLATNVATERTVNATATISDVASSPSNIEGMTNMTGSATMSNQWMTAAGGAPYRIVLDITEWPSSDPASLPAAGELVQITNTYGSVHPIELLFGGN